MYAMKAIVVTLLASAGILLLSTSAFADSTYVQGHTTKDGTYVLGHMRTAPNATKLDNWSTEGNVNPYTGKKGTKDPYKVHKPRI
jgi:hypothetical protein